MEFNEHHEFLIDANDGLTRAGHQMAKVREYLDELTDTAATFRLTDAGVQGQFFEDVHIEFLKSWPVHDMYATSGQRGTRYVNPNYVHAHTYSDIVVECDCGAKFTRNYDDGENTLQKPHEHTDDCMPFHRLRARAEMQERRYHAIRRLGRLGWKGSDMAQRFGSKSDYMGALARDFGLNLRDCYDVYRETAGHTYKHLVIEHGESSKEVAAAYGHAPSTMTRWAKEYTDYDTEVGRNQFTAKAETTNEQP